MVSTRTKHLFVNIICLKKCNDPLRYLVLLEKRDNLDSTQVERHRKLFLGLALTALLQLRICLGIHLLSCVFEFFILFSSP